jgi:hypothetical protein
MLHLSTNKTTELEKNKTIKTVINQSYDTLKINSESIIILSIHWAVRVTVYNLFILL